MDRLNATLASWAPQMLSIFRIMAGLLFMQHGLVKLVGFPMAPPNAPAVFSLIWFAGLIEIVGGALVVIGWFTRPAALIMAGEMAVAYLIVTGRMSRSFFPIVNGGNLEVLYCFAFLYLGFAGAGPWSVDAKISQGG